MQRPKEKEQKDKHRSTKHYTETKRQTQIYKTLHRDKKTNTDLQNTTPRQKDKHRSTKHYTESCFWSFDNYNMYIINVLLQ
jgi:hypothetical protein